MIGPRLQDSGDERSTSLIIYAAVAAVGLRVVPK
jgi:hypothetical protein